MVKYHEKQFLNVAFHVWQFLGILGFQIEIERMLMIYYIDKFATILVGSVNLGQASDDHEELTK